MHVSDVPHLREFVHVYVQHTIEHRLPQMMGRKRDFTRPNVPSQYALFHSVRTSRCEAESDFSQQFELHQQSGACRRVNGCNPETEDKRGICDAVVILINNLVTMAFAVLSTSSSQCPRITGGLRKPSPQRDLHTHSTYSPLSPPNSPSPSPHKSTPRHATMEKVRKSRNRRKSFHNIRPIHTVFS